MGAQFFENYEKILPEDETGSLRDTLHRVFRRAVELEAYESGHGGYTGTLAEKSEVTLVGTVKTRGEASALMDKLVDEDDKRISDKWGPAGAIFIEDDKAYVFFGYASS